MKYLSGGHLDSSFILSRRHSACTLQLGGEPCGKVTPVSFSFWVRSLRCSGTESHPTPCNPVDYSPQASSVHGISQARILEWVAISSRSSQSREESCVSCIGRQILYHLATLEALRSSNDYETKSTTVVKAGPVQ